MYQFSSILPYITEKTGHGGAYQKALEDSCESLEIPYTAYVNKTDDPLPKNWSPLFLSRGTGTLRDMWTFFFDLKKLFKRATSPRVHFIENLRISIFIPLLFSALFFIERKDSLAIVLRFDCRYEPLKNFLYLTSFKLLHLKLKERLRLLSDTAEVQSYINSRLHCNVALLPIPHTSYAHTKQKTGIIPYTFWCPGILREEKGKKTIQTFLLRAKKGYFKGYVDEKSLTILSSPSVPLEGFGHLSRDEYENFFSRVDCLFLPYEPSLYYSRTSGIFVEGIVAGVVPFVKKGTWMAKELEKNDLSELAFTWDEPNLEELFSQCLTSQDLRKRLEVMQKSYRSFHSQSNFTCALKEALLSP